MGKLYAPNGAEITGTLEIVEGRAGIDSVTVDESGVFGIEYDGDTEIFWNAQRTQEDALTGERLFLDDDGTIWRESELVLKEDEDDQRT